MNEQEQLKYNYHLYLEIAKGLPQQMKNCGAFRLGFYLNNREGFFLSNGKIQTDIPFEYCNLNEVNKILEFYFSHDKPINNLKQVSPSQMEKLKDAIKNAQGSLEELFFYDKDN